MDWSRPRPQCYSYPCQDDSIVFVEVRADYADKPFMQTFCPRHARQVKNRDCESYVSFPSLDEACDHYDRCLKSAALCSLCTVRLVLES